MCVYTSSRLFDCSLVVNTLWSSLWCDCTALCWFDIRTTRKGYFLYIVAINIATSTSRLLSNLLTVVSLLGSPQQHCFTPKTPSCPRLEAAGEEHQGDTESGGRCCRWDTCLLRNLPKFWCLKCINDKLWFSGRRCAGCSDLLTWVQPWGCQYPAKTSGSHCLQSRNSPAHNARKAATWHFDT